MPVPHIGQELLNVPMGEMIRQMAFAIADGQFQLDTASIRMAEMMAGKQVFYNEDGSPKLDSNKQIVSIDSRVPFGGALNADGSPVQLSLIELGFTPTFYQFIDTVIEVKIAVHISQVGVDSTTLKSQSFSAGGFSRGALIGGPRYVATVSSVDGAYAARYNYAAEGSSVLRTKLVPVPPPTILEERIRLLLEDNNKK